MDSSGLIGISTRVGAATYLNVPLFCIGTSDTYYFSPAGRRFRSRAEVGRSLDLEGANGHAKGAKAKGKGAKGAEGAKGKARPAPSTAIVELDSSDEEEAAKEEAAKAPAAAGARAARESTSYGESDSSDDEGLKGASAAAPAASTTPAAASVPSAPSKEAALASYSGAGPSSAAEAWSRAEVIDAMGTLEAIKGHISKEQYEQKQNDILSRF